MECPDTPNQEQIEITVSELLTEKVENSVTESEQIDLEKSGSPEESAIQKDETIECPILDSEEYETPDIEGNETTDEHGAEGDNESESSTESQEAILTEREEGDGEESEKKDKKLDHDEDKRDPQYIPKKGNFYEHDDRTSEGEESTAGKKPSTQKAYDSKEQWGHDLYDEKMQSPKSREELIDQYGYDIRIEEGPPKARRRRRYGRGPNKYTRRWEEEEAYSKTRGSSRGRGRGRFSRNSCEDFPPLPVKEAKQKSEGKMAINEVVKKESLLKIEAKVEKHEEMTSTPRKVKVEETQRLSPSKGRGRGRGGRGSQPFRNGPQKPISTTAEEDIATLCQHFSEAVINVDNKSIPSQRASSVPPACTESNGNSKSGSSVEEPAGEKCGGEAKSKRYSTQRQRSLPQGTNGVAIVQQQPPPPPPQRFIQPDQQQYFHQVGLETTAGAPAANQYTNQAPANFTAKVPMMTFMPPVAHQFQPLPAYLPPTYLPPPPIATPPRGPEVYQGPTGITYYNTQSQVSRPVSTSRRVRLAIPIVAPPPESS